MLHERIHIFTGHFGSGKTELAINFAAAVREQYEYVAINDLDVINPYFRTRDAANFLSREKIELLAPQKKLAQADLPIVSNDIYRVLADPNYRLIVDAGGDKDGAKALGQYYHNWKELSPEMVFVLNANRPYVSTLDSALTTINEIEQASRLKVTAIINNTNIGKETSLDDIQKGYDLSLKISQSLEIPILCTTVSEDLREQVSSVTTIGNIFFIKRFMKVSWEI